VTIDPTLQRGAAGAFAAGELVMLWHTVGWSAAVVSGDQTAVDLSASAAGPAGLWELARISSVVGGATENEQVLNLTAPTVRGYLAGEAQVVRVPEYTDLTVEDVELTPAAFDGRSGGIVALLASGTITLATNDSLINVDRAGLPGGALVNDASAPSAATPSTAPRRRLRRQGLLLRPPRRPAAGLAGGRGNRLSGGGGGDCSNSGGGGGGGASLAAGGRGGNDYTTTRRWAGWGAPASTATRASGSSSAAAAARGRRTPVGTAGAPGGGVVFVRAAALAGEGRIRARGGDADAAQNDGAGGAAAAAPWCCAPRAA
jgi:hypothetical protein